MKRWQIWAVIAVLFALGGAYGYYQLHRNDDRFGDPAVLEQIEHANCGELREWSDAVLRVDPNDKEAFDNAVGYSNAANDRMDELHCFDN
jgi:hypothetical protein